MLSAHVSENLVLESEILTLTDFIAKLQDVYLNMASILSTSSGVTLKRYGWSRFGIGIS